MKKKINIEKAMIEVISKIEVDGKEYPLHKWNIEVAREYELTKDKKVLKNLKDFSLEF